MEEKNKEDKKKEKILLSNKSLQNSLLKYSNIALFERREKKLASEKKVIKRPKLFKINKSTKKNISQTKENILLPFSQTMSSFYSMDKSSSVLPLLDYFEIDNLKSKIHKHKTNYFKLNVNNRNNYQINFTETDNKRFKATNNFYLTESSAMTQRNKENISLLLNKDKTNENAKNEENNKKQNNENTLLLIQSYKSKDNNKSKPNNRNQKNYRYNSYINSKSNKNNFNLYIDEDDAKKIMDSKISKYNYYKEPRFKEFIKKTQELKLNSYTSKIKKERAIRLEEGYYNQIEFYQDTINSLQTSRKLLEVNFVNKIADYTRFVMYKREREKVKSSKLIQEIMNYRRDIDHIYTKIKKIEMEKSNIIRWIYFQIQMKEKTLVLPQYYKTILENVDNFASFAQKRLSIKLMSRKDDKLKNKKKSNRRPTFTQAENLVFNSKDGTLNTNNSNQNSIQIKKEDIDKMINYKHSLIFKTPDEFQDRLNSFEQENITLLNYNNELRAQLFELKKELNSLMKDKEKIELEYNSKIIKREKELKNIKIMIESKMKLISDFKKSENFEKNKKLKKRKTLKERKKSVDNKKSEDNDNINNSNEKNNNLEENYNMNDKNKSSLYKKIVVIFNACTIFGSKLQFASYILNIVNKKTNTKEKEMILMLEFIEQSIDYLITNFNFYMNKNIEIQNLIKNVKNDIEKEHKIEKAKIQMLIDLKRVKLLKEKVEKRSNKIYFLPSKKIDLNKFKFKTERKKGNKDKNRMPNIYDYLHNDIE